MYFICRNVVYGPHFNYKNTWGVRPSKSYRGPGPGALRCRCEQTLPNCEPEDGYDVVLVCDNTGGVVDTFCSYSHTVGTAYSEEMSEEMSISVGVSYSMSASYFELFRLKILFYLTYFFYYFLQCVSGGFYNHYI